MAMTGPPIFTAPRILDRGLGIDIGDLARWQALEEQLQQFVTDLAQTPVDEADEYQATRRYVRLMADAELLRLVVPGNYGGRFAHLSAVGLCLARQWLARCSGALDNAFALQGLGSYPVAKAGTATLRNALLPRVATGDTICAFALTETEAGSDVSNMQTRARPDGSGVVLEGEKCFISNAGVADSYVVFAREGSDESRTFGAFWVPGEAPGLTITPIRVLAPHAIGTVHLAGVRVPAEHRLGAPGEGLRVAMATLELFRATVGAAALGLADRAFSAMTERLQTRVQFGKPLARQQGLRFAVAELATEHVAAQLLVYRAAAAWDHGHGSSDQAAMAKLFATETAQRVVDRTVQCFGGLGVTVGSVPEALYREVRALRIYEGASEVQKLVIARALFAQGESAS